ncbi:MinD superfamily P-loop ATPase, contains an inserted ferredoxin domain [Humidesulfovibrio mexicanus]|uniref:MinD superfamily P-loop ATPase, contains an inserted ferredoxin domain n=1 Tax=Humidesulfovibrio mexicanus TaxID=147047 RepID=A0A239CLP2_9BACT|nr:ATP-binding protein [Humidesulfovibrio mexicanus]SNS20859.1 MinD superfamily P-loop ATPase, contains an inserted ferredoxin domain [Humidesulfovibrio mexicanus]
MIYAVASGKGGTGKTTVTASLAAIWDRPLVAADLDVEEPNLHLFLHPALTGDAPAMLEVPEVDPERCTLCGQCAEFCQFKALSVMGKKLLIFPEMCHGCGGCLALCPEGALSPAGRELGRVLTGFFDADSGRRGGFLMGRLRVGEAMSPPLMRQVKALLPKPGDSRDALLDAPPGVSCPAVNAVMDAHCIVLVTEPTPFGLHDLRLAVDAFRPMGKPMGVVVNRAGAGDDRVQRYCADEGVPVWAEIPFSRAVAEAYSRGEVAARALPQLRAVFLALMARMKDAAAASTSGLAAGKEASHA